MMKTKQKFDANCARHNQHVYHLVITWVLLIPLIYFAGGDWFQNERGNNDLVGQYGSLAAAPQMVVNTVTGLAIFAIIFFLIFVRMKSILAVCRKHLVFMALVGLSVISCFWSQFAIKSLELSLCLAVNTLFAFYLCQRFNHEQQMSLFRLLGWVSLILSFILAVFFPKYGISYLGGMNSWQGIYHHKNSCAMMTVFYLTEAFFAQSTTLISRITKVVFIGFSVLLIIMSQSATGKISLVCLFAFTVVMELIKRFSLRDKMIVLLLIVLSGLAFIVTAIVHLDKISYVIGKDPTLTGRTQIWQAAAAAIVKHPIFGYGYRAFWRGYLGESANASLLYGWAITGAHNSFLEVWLDLGVIGLGLFFYSLVLAFRNAKFCIGAEQSTYYIWCVCVIFIIIIVSVDESGVIAGPNNLAWILYIIACVGLSEGAHRIRLERNHA